jgi:hypothetical protein
MYRETSAKAADGLVRIRDMFVALARLLPPDALELVGAVGLGDKADLQTDLLAKKGGKQAGCSC